MNLDIIISFILLIPFVIIGYNKDLLIERKYFIKCMFLSILLILVGIIIENNNENNIKGFAYFSSQILFIFLITNKITRNFYYKLYKREPEFGRYPKYKIDTLYTLFISISIMILPFLIDQYITSKILQFLNFKK